MNLSVFIVFPNFRLICCYCVLVTIIIFDLALENGWLEGQISYFKFVNITFCLLTEPQTMLQLKIFIAKTLFIVKFIPSLWILFIHCSFVYQISVDLIYFSTLKLFLDPCIQPGHYS